MRTGLLRKHSRADRFGFPRTTAKRFKRVCGFQTGDMVKAVVLAGKKTGIYVGKVTIRASGNFNINTQNGTVVEGVVSTHRTQHQFKRLPKASTCRWL